MSSAIHLPPDGAVHRALASPSRARLLSVLRDTGPADARDFARRAALHPNAVRAHLEQLEQAGLVESRTEQTGRRGRPRILFSAVVEPSQAAVAEGYRLIADSLAEALLRREAATAPLDRVVRLLDELGFEPEVARGDGGERVLMNACPFSEAARASGEAVCSAHLGLVRDVLGEAGAELEPTLEPFAGPALCVLRLARTPQ